jgi:hypothetical protein
MKKLVMLLIVISTSLSACVAYEVPGGDHGSYRGDREHDRDGARQRGDHDGEGDHDRQDRSSDDSRRY